MVPLNQLLQDTKKSAQQVLSEFTQLQIRDWPLANSNFRGLKKIELKTLNREL